jgi:hypothetical protein
LALAKDDHIVEHATGLGTMADSFEERVRAAQQAQQEAEAAKVQDLANWGAAQRGLSDQARRCAEAQLAEVHEAVAGLRVHRKNLDPVDQGPSRCALVG